MDNRTALEDSKITIKQGNNIRVLTLITIAYLPLGYVTVSHRPQIWRLTLLRLKLYQGLFSENHGILPANANGQLYAGLVSIFMVGTYGLALSLDKILKILEPRWEGLKGYLSVDNAGSCAEDVRLKERSSSGEASPMSSQNASGGISDMAKVSTGRATGLRGWTRRKGAVYDAGTQLELV